MDIKKERRHPGQGDGAKSETGSASCVNPDKANSTPHRKAMQQTREAGGAVIKPNFDNIPEELKAPTQWVAWKLLPPKKPGGKARKVPFDPKIGRAASTTDPATWCTFEEAKVAYEGGGYDGIGLVLTSDLGLVAHDLDDVVDLISGEIANAKVQQLVAELDTYTEISPSGNGLRIFSKGSLPTSAWRNRKGAFGSGTGLEQYTGGQFLTLTGCRINDKGVESRQAQINEISFRYAETVEAVPGTSTGSDAFHREVFEIIEIERLDNEDAELTPDDEVRKAKMLASKNGDIIARLMQGELCGHASPSERDAALCMHLAFWFSKDAARIDRMIRGCCPDVYDDPSRSKVWDDRRRTTTYGGLTIATTLAKCREVYEPGDTETSEELPTGWISSVEFEAEHLAEVRGASGGLFSRTAATISPAAIKPRPWVISGKLIGGYLHIVQAPGGLGKSTLANVMALAVAAKRHDLLGQVRQDGGVLVYNAEDPRDEMERRLYAAAAHHGIDLAEAHPIIYASGHDHELCLAAAGKNGEVLVNEAKFQDLVKNIRFNGIRLIILDPLVRLHRCGENSNAEMDVVARVFTLLARLTDAAVVAVHHTSKAAATKQGNAESMDAGRGASAVVDAARICFNLLGMDKTEAKKAGLSERGRLAHMRLHNSKNNLAPAAAAAWFHKATYTLPSGETVAVAEPAKLNFVEEIRPEDDPDLPCKIQERVIETVRERLATGGNPLTRITLMKLKGLRETLESELMCKVTQAMVGRAIDAALAAGKLEIERKQVGTNLPECLSI